MSKAELEEYQYQLDQLNGALLADASNAELLTLKSELEDLISLTQQTIELNASIPAEPVWEKKRRYQDREALKKEVKTGDTVMAKWVSGDHQFYAAKVTSVTGSTDAPVYTVRFLEYTESQTLQSHQIKRITESKKRSVEIKLDAARPKPPPPPPGLAPVNAPPPPPPRQKLQKEKAELDKGKESWKTFATKGPKRRKGEVGRKRPIGEDSMFRTPDEIEGRVGVIGSGRAMTKENGVREKHKYDAGHDDY